MNDVMSPTPVCALPDGNILSLEAMAGSEKGKPRLADIERRRGTKGGNWKTPSGMRKRTPNLLHSKISHSCSRMKDQI
jgi:hypothetical protein